MKKELRIFIAGHNGMVGKSLVNYFTKKKFGKLILVSRKELNLENFAKVNQFIKKKKPHVIINCAGRVGGILANSEFPTEFLNENIQIQTNLIKSAAWSGNKPYAYPQPGRTLFLGFEATF